MPKLWLTRFENTTTGINLLGAPHSADLFKVSGVSKKGLSVMIPLNSCPKGHLVVIDIRARIENKDYEMQATGLVTHSEKSGEAQAIDVEFRTFDQKTWGKLIRFIDNKQLRADQIFTSIKGEK